MNRITILIPVLEGGEATHRTLSSLLTQGMDFCAVLCTNGNRIALPETPDPRITVIHDEFRNLSQMKYYVFRHWPGRMLLELPEGCELAEEALQAMQDTLVDSGIGACYGWYNEALEQAEQTELIRPRLYPGDLTERVNTGPLMAYSWEAYAAAGGYDPAFNTAQEYDLRLRITDDWQIVCVEKTLCTIYPRKGEDQQARSLGASKVFSPGEGPQGGFTYLFYGPAEEMEFETAFKNYLRSRGAYLCHTPATVAMDREAEVAVSVVIPFWNRERFIGKAIESVIRGSWQDFEILCVNNCSEDGSAEVVRDWERRDSRVRLIENDRNVIARALNLGVTHARGRFIAQLDSDDEYTVNTLASAVRHLDEHPNWGLAISYYELMEESGDPLPEFGIIKHLEYDPNNHLRVDGAGAIRVWHRSVIQEMGGFDEEQYGDFAEGLRSGSTRC